MTYLKVYCVAFIEPLLHFIDCLHRVLVDRFEIVYAILDKERTCNRPVQPVDLPVRSG